MKNRMAFCFFIVNIFFSFILSVNANSISKIDMDVYIDKNGNAEITETWNAYLTEGTEGYKTFKNLDNSVISDFKVSDDTGVEYESLSYWYTNNSFEQKAYKSGIHKIDDGVELCWGISKKGQRTYILKYKLSNLVTQYTDTQGIYFNFMNLDFSVEEASISIRSDIPLSLENAKIWAFGNKGNINFKDGKIVYNGNYLSENQYMVALVRFESNVFETNNISDKSFDDIYDSAFGDVIESTNYESTTNKTNEPTTIKDIINIILSSMLILIIFNPLVWITVFLIYVTKKSRRYNSGYRYSNLDFGPEGKSLPSENEINYWREIPCNKDLEKAYWVCYNYDVVSTSTLKEGIIGAVLLKWIKNGYITVTETKKGLLSIKDNNYAIDFTKMNKGDTNLENSLFEMLVNASRGNKILEPKEFAKWSKRNYLSINQWFKTINDSVEYRLEKEELITVTSKEVPSLFGRTKKTFQRHVTPKLREEAIHLKGLQKFLLDFSNMPEREYIEVHTWEEYLIFAELLGIADKVEEQFSKLYPKFNDESSLKLNLTTTVAKDMAEICYNSIVEAQEKADRSSTRLSTSHDYSGESTSSGGGGSSYDSGGSSSGGSSGGGFR